jgi:predicted kinase
MLYILRGLPGSGKSTKARKLVRESLIASADHFFIQPNGDYLWKASEIGNAHAHCRGFARALLSNGLDCAVDNTNTMNREFKPYIDLAMKYGHKIKIIMPETEWAWDVEECAKRNTHNVPVDAIQRMKDRFEYNVEI